MAIQQGMSQQTPAVQNMLRVLGAKRSNGKKRTRKASAKKTTTRKKRKSSSKPARLVKGSAAAKRYMAKIRKKRK